MEVTTFRQRWLRSVRGNSKRARRHKAYALYKKTPVGRPGFFVFVFGSLGPYKLLNPDLLSEIGVFATLTG